MTHDTRFWLLLHVYLNTARNKDNDIQIEIERSEIGIGEMIG